MNLLVIDFDYFFPNPLECCSEHTGRQKPLMYDWGHRESTFFIDDIWSIRGSAFALQGIDKPGTNGEELLFWQRFKIDPEATLYYADSNAYAASNVVMEMPTSLLSEKASVWLFDAHHDSGYHRISQKAWERAGRASCEDWMRAYHAQKYKLHVRYPTWKRCWYGTDPAPVSEMARAVDRKTTFKETYPVFDRVFVCRSGAWVPSWCEDAFWQFIDRAPVDVQRRIAIEHFERRTYDAEAEHVYVEAGERMKVVNASLEKLLEQTEN